jgi:dihydrofolate synthase / folylpolyglutamate synthase
MQELLTKKQAEEYLEQVRGYGSKMGLDAMRDLLARLQNPQSSLRFIHIAGTNGKGSQLAYLSNILAKAGYKTGCYVSPVVFDDKEKIQINGKNIARLNFLELLTQIKSVTDEMLAEGVAQPTIFEVETALSFLYFKQENCDLVVLETGLGGLLDATNVVENTELLFLHPYLWIIWIIWGYLTKNSKIKAGIIKNGCYVITQNQKTEVLEVLQNEAAEKNCPFFLADQKELKKVKYGFEKQYFTYGELEQLEIRLPGKHQVENAQLAVKTIQTLRIKGYQISDEAIRTGLKTTKWPGRMEVIGDKPKFIIDGAHNQDAAARLAESIRLYFKGKHIIYIMGILKDKEYEKIVQETYAYADQIITVTTPNLERTLKAYDLAMVVKEYHPNVTVADSLEEAIEMSYLLSTRQSVIVCFGSLSFLGEVKKIIKKRN